jgi:outer membrane receptor protein involved in Fe transport
MQFNSGRGRITKSVLFGATALTAGFAMGGVSYAADAPAKATSTVTEVVVTGSRIARRDFTAPSPIVTVNSQTFQNRAGPEVEQTLNQLPQFHADLNSQIGQAAQTQPSASSTPGAAFLNLRGLGPNRNLVLIDGRRAQPTNGSLIVDVNTIPAAMIDNVEIVTGGASAVYGADAVAGVVNFKLKHNFQGMEVDAQYGISEHGDNREPNVSAVIGTNFPDDKGNVTLSATYTQRSVVFAKDRPFQDAGINDPHTNSFGSYPFLPFAALDWGANATFIGLPGFFNGASQAALDAVLPGVYASPFAQNSISVNPDQSLFYSGVGANGSHSPGYTGPLGHDTGFKIQNSGTLGYSYPGSYLSPPTTKWGIFGSADYHVTDHVTAYLQGMYSWQQVKSQALPSPAVQFWGAAIPHDGQHPVPAALETLLNSRNGGVDMTIPGIGALGPDTPWALEVTVDNIVGPRNNIATTNTYQIVGGLKGDVPGNDWTWDLYGSQGHTDILDYSSNGFVSTQSLRKFLALPNYGANGTISQASLESAHCTSGFYQSIFLGQLPSQDCQDAISARMHSTTALDQKVVEADVTGGLFQIPAGQVRFSLGADYREDGYVFSVDPLLNTLNVVDAPVGLFPTASTQGFINVKEGYGELLVPVLKDLPFAKSFNLSLGARYSDYNTAGGSWTYKILGDYALNDWISFRGGYQRAERAPNVAELFQPISPLVVGASSGDPCANPPGNPSLSWNNSPGNSHRLQTQELCLALIQKTNPNAGSTFYVPGGTANTYTGLFPFFFPITIDQDQGNLNLKPEVAKSYTAGIVLRSPVQSPLLSRTRLSVDWYDIQIAGAIIPLTSETLYEQCLNADGHSNPTLTITGNQFCDFILREAVTGGNRTANNPYFNFGGLETEGVDVQLDWGADFADMGISGVPGGLNLNFVLNWLGKYSVQTAPGDPSINYVGTVNGAGGSQFRYRTFTTLTYNNSVWNLGMRWRHFPGAKDASILINPATTVQGVGSHDEFDLFSGYKLSAAYQLRFGIDNLFNRQPEVVGRDTGPSPNASLGSTLLDYDVLGRRFYVGIKARF